MEQEALVTEFGVCKRKLHSKEAALKIIKAELDYEREQKEHYKHVVAVMVGSQENNSINLEQLSLKDITAIVAKRDHQIESLEEKIKELKSIQEKSVTGEYSISLLQELLTQRSQWTKERQDLIHQLEIVTEQVTFYHK